MMYRFASVLMLVCVIQRPEFTCCDNLALLSGTLKTIQQAACDDEIVSLACPRGTSINIQVAQYGKMSSEGHSCQVEGQPLVSVEVQGSEKCLWPNDMQYSLLQTVVETCQKKPHCKFSTQPKSGPIDPCPHARKFVEVAYKCRPNEFRIRAVCEDDIIRLSCNPYSRVAIYDAQYGRTAFEPLTCPQPQGVHNKTCMAEYATRTVMQLCHGKRRCDVTANSKNFGTPCKPETRTYLKIVYACVPLGVLTERYESAAEKDEILDKINDNSITEIEQEGLFDEKDGVGEKWGEPSVVPPAPALANPALQYPHQFESKKPKEKSKDNIGSQTSNKIEAASERSSNFYIYIGVGVIIFLIITILFIGVHCYVKRRNSDDSKTSDMFSTEVPNVFNDAVSEIDNDIDVSHISGTFYEHPDMILYRDVPGNKGTIKAMRPLSTIYPCAGSSMYGNVDYVPTHSRETNVDRCTNEGGDKIRKDYVVSPKTLNRYSDSQYFYG